MVNQYKKTKHNIGITIFIVLISLTLSSLVFLPKQASAAPQCYEPLAELGGGTGPKGKGSPGIVPCDSGVFPQSGIVDVNSNKCYKDSAGNASSVTEVPCTQAPFTQYSVVTCADGQQHYGLAGKVTFKEICKPFGGVYKTGQPCNSEGDICGFFDKYINPAVKFLGAGVGIIATIMIIIGGIQYSSSADDPQKVAAAKSKIFNAVLALIAYALLFALLQWLIPGGVL